MTTYNQKSVFLEGCHFIRDGREFVVIWNDNIHLRATPVDSEAGLTWVDFRIGEVGLDNMWRVGQ